MSLSLNYPTIQPSLNLDFANTDRLDPRVTFTRASPGTYYDGVTTAKAEENLLLQSQTFETTWTQGNANVTANSTTAPDGTTTADTLVENTANNFHALTQILTLSGATTVSFYLKANTRSWAAVRTYDVTNGDRFALFDLSTGSLGSTSGGTTSTITSVGNGWYRCTMTYTFTTASGSAGVTIQTGNSYVAYTGNGTGSIFVWGAQLEQRSSATAYTVTTTQPITRYQPVLLTAAANVPRFEHVPTTGESLGLEIEETRTNLIIRSADLAETQWIKYASTVTSNTIIAPDGTLTGDKFVEDTSNAVHAIEQRVIVDMTSTTYTFSFFAKAGEKTSIYAEVAFVVSPFPAFFAVFNLANGTVVTSSARGIAVSAGAAITAVGNGWYRCSISGYTGGNGNQACGLYYDSGSVYTGNGWNGAFLWGAQLELGAFPTSYIATVATAQTRAADLASMTGTNFSSWYNIAEGTLYASYQVTSNTQLRRILYLGNSVTSATYTNFIAINALSVGTAIFGEIYTETGQAAVNLGTNLVNANNQVALAFKTNDVYGIQNNTTGASDSSCVIPTVDRMFIGRALDGTFFNGTIKKIAYYPLRLTNAQLQNLTK